MVVIGTIIGSLVIVLMIMFYSRYSTVQCYIREIDFIALSCRSDVYYIRVIIVKVFDFDEFLIFVKRISLLLGVVLRTVRFSDIFFFCRNFFLPQARVI